MSDRCCPNCDAPLEYCVSCGTGFSRFEIDVPKRPDQPQRVQPSREDVARLLAHQNTDWIHGYLGADPATGETHDHGPRCSNWEPYAEDADAVLALFSQQPTVAEVKAEALREAADNIGWEHPAASWLRDLADRIEREARP